MYLILNPALRQANSGRFEQYFASGFTSGPRLFLKQLPSQENPCAFVDQGFFIWKSAVEQAFGVRTELSQELLRFRESALWREGYLFVDEFVPSDICMKLRALLYHPEEARTSFPIDSLLSNEDDASFFDDFIEDLLCSWSRQYLPHGIRLIPWRIYAYQTKSEAQNLSMRWHYDLDQPDHSLFLMLNLNTPSGQFCDFGTSFLDASQSMLLSSRTGYISTPLTHRVKNINEIDFGGQPLSVDMIRSKCGSVVAFQPGRVLHRGVNDPGGVRQSLHISASIVQDCDVPLLEVGSSSAPSRIPAISEIIQSVRSEEFFITPSPYFQKSF